MTGLSNIIIAQAQAAPDSALTIPLDDPRFLVVLIVVGLPTLLGTLNGVLSVIKFFKADPPTYKLYATKEELHHAELRLNTRLDADAKELDEVEQRLMRSQEESEKRLQSHLNGQDSFQMSLQQELKSIHSQLGELSGLLKNRRTH